MEAGGASLPSRPRLRRSPHAVFRPRPFPGAVPQWSGDVVRGPRLRWVRSRPTAQPTPHPPPARRCGVPAAGTSSPGAELRARRLLCVAAPVPGRSAGDGGEEKAVPPPASPLPVKAHTDPLGPGLSAGCAHRSRPPGSGGSISFGTTNAPSPLLSIRTRSIADSEHRGGHGRPHRGGVLSPTELQGGGRPRTASPLRAPPRGGWARLRSARLEGGVGGE